MTSLRSLAFALVVMASCQRNETPPHASTPPAEAHDASLGERVDVNGIAVRFVAGGAIEMTGHDRWGNPIDTTYENKQYLRDALPVLERSITSDQAAQLRALLDKH